MAGPTTPDRGPRTGNWALVALAWTLVGVPLAWGIYQTLRSAVALFK